MLNKIKSLSSYTNNFAIGLSGMCVLHCLATPLLLALLPSLSALNLESEAFHRWLLIAVIPTSLFSLAIGCKQHQYYRVLVMGALGLLVLVSAVFVEDLANGELLEKVLTVSGAVIIALAHIMNFRLCKKQQCECHES